MPEKPLKFGIRPVATVAEASSREQPVILYCLSCGRSRKAHPWAMASFIEAAPFGLIIGNLCCRGCGERVGVILPSHAPTPRAWAQVTRLRAGRKATLPAPAPVTKEELHYSLETWTGRGAIDRVVALIDHLFVGHAAFDEALVQFPKTKITLRAKAQVIRDSDRPDVKSVK